jgi:hypothetical protein
MDSAIYMMCALTSAVCAYLLGASYFRTRLRLLLWAASCFTILAFSNLLLYLDLTLIISSDISILRSTISLCAVIVLLVGMIWETV